MGISRSGLYYLPKGESEENLLRNLTIDHPNQVWEIDITYIPMYKGFMYLTEIIDVYSRFIVGWGLHNSLHGDNVIEVLNAAIQQHGIPEIVNSDQGNQFTSPAWVNKLNELGISISMDGRGRATDNIYIERFWRTLKQDYVYPCLAEDGIPLWKGIKKFIDHCNKEKTHQGVGRQTPESIYRFSA